jgi:glycosyltransferase involved in cell wall biosynthesis
LTVTASDEPLPQAWHSPATRRVLFVQHAGGLGGSCVSLLHLVRALDRDRYTPVIAFARPAPEVVAFYASCGAETIEAPDLATFEHTTASWSDPLRPSTWSPAMRTLSTWRRAEHATLELVQTVEPDLVHLNSVVLYPSARALHRARVPFVWHVREYPVRGWFGLRRGLQRAALRRWPAEVFFLSEAEKRAWVAGTRGRVVPNFVDLEEFEPSTDPGGARAELGIPVDAPVVLYVGGLAPVKGVDRLLRALALVRRREPRLLCLMPGAEPVRLQGLARAAQTLFPLLGLRTFTQLVDSIVAEHDLAPTLRRLPFVGRMQALYAASDLVVFPALADHFSRPILEAGAMGRAVVASWFPVIEEQVRDGETGMLVPPGDAPALAQAILELLADPARRARMGAAGRALAVARYDARRNIQEIMDAYEEALPARR